MKEKLRNFMIGRYGTDQFSRFLTILTLVFCVLYLLFRSPLLFFAAVLALVYSYFRMLSKNHQKRYAENLVYIRQSGKIKAFFKGHSGGTGPKTKDKNFHIYNCPKCRQKIRIPRGKGKISIKCPKCGTEFVKRS